MNLNNETQQIKYIGQKARGIKQKQNHNRTNTN